MKDEKELARKKAAEAIAAAHESNRKQFEAVGLEYDVVRRGRAKRIGVISIGA